MDLAFEFESTIKTESVGGCLEYEIVAGLSILIDEDDVKKIVLYRWRAIGRSMGKIQLCGRPKGTGREITLTRLLLNAQPNTFSQWRNGNRLDYRKSNLESVSMAVRQARLGKRAPEQATSRFKGVSFSQKEGCWTASIRPQGESYSLGSFNDEEAAARAYDQAALRFFGEEAYTNFEVARSKAA